MPVTMPHCINSFPMLKSHPSFPRSLSGKTGNCNLCDVNFFWVPSGGLTSDRLGTARRKRTICIHDRQAWNNLLHCVANWERDRPEKNAFLDRMALTADQRHALLLADRSRTIDVISAIVADVLAENPDATPRDRRLSRKMARASRPDIPFSCL